MFSISPKAYADLPVPPSPLPPYLAPSLLWRRTKALWSSLHAAVKIEHRCWAIYAQPKTLFYRHINSMESTRLMSTKKRRTSPDWQSLGPLKSSTDDLGISKGLICRAHVAVQVCAMRLCSATRQTGNIWLNMYIYLCNVLHRYMYIETQHRCLRESV